METNKHYLIENCQTYKHECFKVLKILENKLLIKQIPSGTEKEMNKDYATKNAVPCPIIDEILPYFGFHQVDRSPAFKNGNEILVRFKKYKVFEPGNLSGNAEIRLIGYAKISANELKRTNVILSKSHEDNWDQTVKENYDIITTIDELLK